MTDSTLNDDDDDVRSSLNILILLSAAAVAINPVKWHLDTFFLIA